MTLDEFADLVHRMRDMQRSYFRRRTPEALEASKELERQVDKATAEIRNKQRALFPECSTVTQLDLDNLKLTADILRAFVEHDDWRVSSVECGAIETAADAIPAMIDEIRLLHRALERRSTQLDLAISECVSECVKLRADAARWRYVREHGPECLGTTEECDDETKNLVAMWPTGEEADAALDRAIQVASERRESLNDQK